MDMTRRRVAITLSALIKQSLSTYTVRVGAEYLLAVKKGYLHKEHIKRVGR